MTEDTRSRTVPPIPMLAQPQLPVPMPTELSLSDLTAQICQAHNEATAAVARGAWFAIKAGHGLIGAKALLKAKRLTGMFQEYVNVECRMPLRTAQHYMHMAKREDQLRELVGPDAQGIAFISQAQAIKLLGAAKKKRRRATTKRVASVIEE